MDRIKLATLWFLDTFFEKYLVFTGALILMALNQLPTPHTVSEALLFIAFIFILDESIEYSIKKIK